MSGRTPFRRESEATAGSGSGGEANLWRRLAPLVVEFNRALIHTRDEAALVRDVCRILVRRGGYRRAWVQQEADRSAPRPAGRAPRGTDWTSGSSRVKTSRSSALPGRGARAEPLLLPLREGRDVLGILHVACKSQAFPGSEEVRVLEQLAGNLAVRINRLRAGWQHRETKNAVIDSLKRFHASLEATPLVAIQRVDRAGVVRHWNEASTRLYGFTPDQAIGRRLADLLLESDQASAFDRLLPAAWETGRGVAALEWDVTCAEGQRRSMCASLVPIREESRVVDVFCMEVDITDRRRAEAALQDSETRYRDLVDAAPLAVLVHQEGIVRFANAAALELLGAHQPDELCWRPLASLVHPEVQQRFEDLASEGSRRPIELALVRLDGGVVDAEVARLPLRWENRPAEQWLIRDRTLTNRMQRELEAARGKLARIFDSSPAAIAICSLPEERLIEANPAFWRLLGYERKELLGRTLAELGMANEGFAIPHATSPRRPEDRMPSFEVAFPTRNGALRQALASVDEFDFGGQRSRLLILIDITERKQLESDLRESQKLEAMGLLARGVAHDLNNILTVIRGHQSLIPLGSHLAPQARDSLAGITEAVERASDLTRQLLTFSRKRPLEARRVDLNELVGGVASMLRRMLGRQIELKLRCAPRLGSVWADPGMIEQVILNLAVNARDAMPRGGRLTLATELRFVRHPPRDRQPSAAAGDYLCLVVQDTGQGIAPENVSRVFEPFFTTKTNAKGTGLGLATVSNIVQQHRGWVDVESVEHQGTAFRVYLPALAEVSAPARKLRSAVTPAAGRPTILVVEDEATVRELARQVLERSGYRVLAAESGCAATRLWRKHRADIQLLIADLVLPGGMDGGELAQRLQSERPELRVILSTGYGAELESGHWLALNSARLLPKPFAPDALARYVQECLAEG